LKTISLGITILISLSAMSMSLDLGKNLGPDVSPNWDNAWNFLKTQTPEFSLVGTWWDPGHMITGLAERRVIADGAHCGFSSEGGNLCYYTINDRIVDLGKIMATNNESISMELIRKYQGDSPKVYWIASDDLIGKYQWLQYFGMGCDSRTDASCPIYMQLSVVNAFTIGGVPVRNYGADYNGDGTLDVNILSVDSTPPSVLMINGRTASIFTDVLFYDQSGTIRSYSVNNKTAAYESLKALGNALNLTLVNNDISYSVWIPSSKNYIVLIPPNLKNAVFTKMFMEEGSGLLHFKQVFRNDEVKIYEVIP
jgi:hypothetical protein